MKRRDFLKIGTIGAAALSLETQFSGLVPIFGVRGKHNSLYSRRLRKGIPSTCDMCPARCGIIGFTNYENLTAIQGNPRHINNRGRICSRGIAGINQIYDPDRIITPLKRTGMRGDGKWEKISWDEALSLISERLIAIRRTRRDDAFVFHADSRHVRGLARRFLRTCGRPTILPSYVHLDCNKTKAQKMIWGEENSVDDAAHCNYFLNFGSNPYESHPFYINFTQRLIDGRINNHARLITIDPRLSNTAGKSDEWIPVKPGTDAIVALAMANVIMGKGLHDAEFIGNWTNVTEQELKSHLEQFTPEKAAEISQVEKEKIERIATEFAINRPAIAFSGAGMSRHLNGVENERCILLLNAIVGSIDRKGGVCIPRSYELNDFTALNDPEVDANPYGFFSQVSEKQKQVDIFFAYMSNPAYENPDCHFTESVLKDEKLLPFTVVMDTVMSETAALADLVLPAATFLESWDLDPGPSFEMVPFVSLTQPVIVPPGETKSLNDFIIQLSQRMGDDFQRAINYFTTADYLRDVATKVPGLTRDEGFDRLKTDGIWYRSDMKPEYEIYRSRQFRTPTGRFEIASSAARRENLSSLPTYRPIREHVGLAAGELVLIPHSMSVMSPDLANLKWLSEIKHSNQAVMNSKTARRLKIQKGDRIVIESATGKIEAEAFPSEGIHPDAIALCNSLGHWEYGRIARAQKFTSDDPDTELLWWSQCGKGSHPNIIIPVNVDPVGKGQAWSDTIVKIRKA